MIISIFRFFLFVASLVLIFWLYNINNTVVAHIGSYEIYTSIPKLFIILIVIFLFMHYIVRPISKSIDKIYYKQNISNLSKLIEQFNSDEEKPILKTLLEHHYKKKDIMHIQNIKSLMSKHKYDSAISYINKNKINPKFTFILKYYLCIAYAAKKENDLLIAGLKNAISFIKQNNFWFFNTLLNINLETPNLQQLEFLNNKVSHINFPDDYTKKYTICKVCYALATEMLENSNPIEANVLLENVIHKYPDFIPAYELLLQINNKIYTKKQTQKLLEKSWIAHPCYLGILLWKEYYKTTSDNIENELYFALKNSKNIVLNNLLIAALYIKSNQLMQANEILAHLPNDITAKLLVDISLYAKEKDHASLMFRVNTLISQTVHSYWWGNLSHVHN